MKRPTRSSPLLLALGALALAFAAAPACKPDASNAPRALPGSDATANAKPGEISAGSLALQAGHDDSAAAAPQASPGPTSRGVVYRIARIDHAARNVSLRPVDPAMTVSVDARARTPELELQVLRFSDLEHLVGGGHSADEIVGQMSEGGEVTLYRDPAGRLTKLSY